MMGPLPVSFAHALDRLDAWQQRSAAVAVPVAVFKKFVDDRADALGAQVAYWGFFSVFSLLLVFVSILGFVFESDPAVQKQVLDSTLERMPVIGPQISGEVGSLTGSGVALAVGVAGALWTGLGVTLALGRAFDRMWAVPRFARSGFARSRLRGLLVLLVAGGINVVVTVAVGLAEAGEVRPAVASVLSVAASAGIDLALFLACFRLLTAARVTTRQVLPGAVLAAGCLLALQVLGGAFITGVLRGSSQTYGGFAAVVGLLTWLLIAAELTLIAAELNVVLDRRLWPRSLTGQLRSADRRALRDSARAAQLDPREHIAVTFSHRDEDPPSSP